MKTLRIGLGLVAVGAVCLLPSAAAAQPVVPPGNSGANQYQETLPGASGEELPPGTHRSPKKALGPAKARRLERLGPAGRATAALAAAAAATPRRRATTGPQQRRLAAARGDGGGAAASASQPSGSSGWHEVLEQATGSTASGKAGLLLPLVLVAALLGAVVYVARRRTSHSS